MNARVVPYIQVSAEMLEVQLKAANRRIKRMDKLHMDDERAEGVRDTISWIMGLSQAPYKGEIDDAELYDH